MTESFYIGEAKAFFQASVYARTFVFIAFALVDLARPMLVFFGTMDFCGRYLCPPHSEGQKECLTLPSSFQRFVAADEDKVGRL